MEVQNKEEFQFQRQFQCTHITALKAFHNFLLVAESNRILLYDWKEKILLKKEVVFQSSSIHGIRIGNAGFVLFFGSKSLKIYANFTISKSFIKISEEIYLEDWIHDVQWLSTKDKLENSIAILSAHNNLTLWNVEKGRSNAFQCVENCILYAGSIICKDEDTIIVAVGTVFKKILLWSPNSKAEICGLKVPFQSLAGHQGVIFSVTYSKRHKLLCSTSDDRSVRLWKIQSIATNDSSLEFWEKATIQIAHVCFAHESRVWMSAILDSCILSVGEDSSLCFWDLQGNLLEKKKCHKNGSVWCLETAQIPSDSEGYTTKDFVAFTGGSDGGVCMWNVDVVFSSGIVSQISLHSRDIGSASDFPRVTFLLTNDLAGQLMVTTDKGWLTLYNMEMKSWKDVFHDTSFASYCVPALSSKSTCLALGNICGELTLMNPRDQYSGAGKKFGVHNGKICSLHWVNEKSDYLLTCGLKGHMILLKITNTNEEFEIRPTQGFQLPKCKHHWWSTAALYIENKDCIIVGDRGGSICVYFILPGNSTSELINPSIVHRYIHGENGVTDIQLHNSLIYSSGRDGKVQLYKLNDKYLNLLHTIKVSHDLEWIGKMFFHDQDLLLAGFHTKDFVVWSTQLESVVMTVDCGGGHRAWDFFLSEDGHATFVAIKKKDVIFCNENLKHALENSILKTGISGQEFCHSTFLFTKNYRKSDFMSVVACGGEDNALRIVGFLTSDGAKIAREPQIVTICSLSGHLSSIRAINKVKMPDEDAYLLVSVGGRSQMIIWKLIDDLNIQFQQMASYILSSFDKKPKQQCKENHNIQINPQTRLMDVAICSSERGDVSSGKYIISTACSDSFFRIYTFDINLKKLSLLYNAHHGENCILKLSQIFVKNCADRVYFATGATDGCIKIFNYKEFQTSVSSASEESITVPQPLLPDLEIKAHQSGINALDVKHIEDTTWILCSAGDDNSISVAMVDIFVDGEKKN